MTVRIVRLEGLRIVAILWILLLLVTNVIVTARAEQYPPVVEKILEGVTEFFREATKKVPSEEEAEQIGRSIVEVPVNTVRGFFESLTPKITAVYGLSEEEAEEFYQKFKEFQEGLIDQVDRSTVEYYTEGEVSDETLKAMNIEEYAARKEVVSNPEFIEEFKSVYNKTNGFTENLEAWGALFKEFHIKYRDRVLETTEIPESRELHQKLKEESLMTNRALGTANFWEFEPETEAERKAEADAIAAKVKEEFDPKRILNMTEAELEAEADAIAAEVKEEFKEKIMTNNTEVGTASGASTLEEQLKLAQEKLEEAGVYGEFGIPREYPEPEPEINIEKVRAEIMLLKILLEQVQNELY